MPKPCYLLVLMLWTCLSAKGDTELRIAVASNFHGCLEKLAAQYREQHPTTRFSLIPGSTGKLYAQILQGAPFEAFFAADAERPRLLESKGHILADSRFTFAYGRLAFWQPGSKSPSIEGARSIALANPKLAPYGLAAKECLDSLSIDDKSTRLVYGSNVAQAYAFAHSGAVDGSFVAYAQLLENRIDQSEYIIVETSRHSPIEQQAVALSHNEELLSFLRFCQSKEGLSVIEKAGYETALGKLIK